MRTVVGAFILLVAACGATEEPAGLTTPQSTSSTSQLTTATTELPAAEPGIDDADDDSGPDADAGATTTEPAGLGADGNEGDGEDSSPTDIAAGRAFSSAAVVGCSQTRDAVFGYNEVADDGAFGPSTAAQYLGGGSIEAWANPASRYWRDFDELAGPENDAMWLMICWHAVRSVDADVEMVRSVIDRAIETIGRDVPVYVSGLNDWDPRSLCPRGDFPASVELADAVVAEGLALRGPDLGPLLREHTDDGCHGNRAGNELMGRQLVEFFG